MIVSLLLLPNQQQILPSLFVAVAASLSSFVPLCSCLFASLFSSLVIIVVSLLHILGCKLSLAHMILLVFVYADIDPCILGVLVLEFSQKVFDMSSKTRAQLTERIL
ncbi:hypothetical protein VNO78_13037 [Psophocarpus tetragonolobus]|uniref:Uncharacterized protein n=1 Tax=Psophocarpus tetragonolobus TaxID=3891 RepID=A0AAN9SP04_PSOTE